MIIKKTVALLAFFFLFASPLLSQAVLQADGPGNTYELINSVLAPGYDVVENPECVHPQFGRHIAEIWDSELNKYVFEFYIHVTPDNDRCQAVDRQRMEIKTYESSPANLKGVGGETVTYKWRFRLPVGFQPSTSFTHIHQIKAVGGNDDDPIFTLTPRKGSPNKIELKHDNTTVVATANLSLYEGVWVECTEVIKVGTAGTYSLIIKKVSDGTTLLSYSSNSIMTIRSDNNFIRPKWGIYRSLNNASDLRDEAVRFADFYLSEGTTLTIPNAPAAAAATLITDSGFRANWSAPAGPPAVTGYRIDVGTTSGGTQILNDADAGNNLFYLVSGLTGGTNYYYRVRAYNSIGTGSNSNVAMVTTQQTQFAVSAAAVPSAGGAVTGTGTFSSGSNVTLTAAANTGYTFVTWTENGVEQSKNSVYTFVLSRSRNLAANFKEVTLIEQSGELPSKFELYQNYPNPFNPFTTISYSIPNRSNVKLRVYNMLAQVEAELVNEFQEAGYYQVTLNGNNLPSGTYFYKLEAGKFIEVKKFLLVK